jgi:hypothetical protein
MMLEWAPDFSFAVLAPAFQGNEGYFALEEYAGNTCTFFHNGLCDLFLTKFRPLECRFCHHTRLGLGRECHWAIERDWRTSKGRRLVTQWLHLQSL